MSISRRRALTWSHISLALLSFAFLLVSVTEPLEDCRSRVICNRRPLSWTPEEQRLVCLNALYRFAVEAAREPEEQIVPSITHKRCLSHCWASGVGHQQFAEKLGKGVEVGMCINKRNEAWKFTNKVANDQRQANINFVFSRDVGVGANSTAVLQLTTRLFRWRIHS